jgi:TetR/AcrR family transcriptional regulator, transcriptional repressor for nem operon
MKHTKKAIATRKRIVDTAAQLIFTAGYGKTKLMDVLQAANVQKGNFYYYFTSKDELGLAVMRERGRQLLLDWLNSVISPTADPWDNLTRVVTEVAHHPTSNGRPTNPLANLAYEMGELGEEFRRELANIADAVIEVLAGEFARLVAQKRLAAGSDRG